MRLLAVWVFAGVLAFMANVPATAGASFPGRNGEFVWSIGSHTCVSKPEPPYSDCFDIGAGNWEGHPAWSSAGTRIALSASYAFDNWDILTINPDGSNVFDVTHADALHSEPSWAPGDARLYFVKYADEINSIGADGSGLTNLTNNGPDVQDWRPDAGSHGRIAFVSNRDSPPPYDDVDIYVMNADGSDVRRLTELGSADWPDWSPDGKKIAFNAYQDGSREIYVMDADGSNQTRITTTPENEWHPVWSPDGTKIAFQQCLADCGGGFTASIVSMNPDGSGREVVASTQGPHQHMDLGFDWQPLPVNTPSSHVRPIAASPIYVSLVPTYGECTGAGNRTHGPPLAYPSCAPPQETSPNLTVRSPGGDNLFKASVRLAVRLGPPGGVDDTDVRLRASISHVMHASDFSEYTGELRATAKVRVTDKEVPVSSTIQDFPLEFDVPCVATPDPNLKSTCDVVTGLDVVIPGASPEGTRAVWALDQVKVYDGGPDGDGATEADNSLFATQGLFVP